MPATATSSRPWSVRFALFVSTMAAAVLTWVCAVRAYPFVPAHETLEFEMPLAYAWAADLGGLLRDPARQPILAGIFLGVLLACARLVPQRLRARFAWSLAVLLMLVTAVLWIGVEVHLANLNRAHARG